MPRVFEMLPVVFFRQEHSVLAECTFLAFLLLFFGGELLFLQLGDIFLFLNLFLELVQELQSAALISKLFDLSVDHGIHQNLDRGPLNLLAHGVDLPIFIRLNQKYFHNLLVFNILAFYSINLHVFGKLFNLVLLFLWIGQANLHGCSRNLVSFLKQFDAVQCLALSRLVQFHREMDVFHSCLYRLERKMSSSDGMDTFLIDDVGDISLHVENLNFPLLVSDLEVPLIQNNLDDLCLGFVGEVFVQVGLLCDQPMVCILVNLIRLEDLGYIIFEPVAPVNGLVPVAGNLECLVVHLVLDEGHVCHLDNRVRLLQHSAIIIIDGSEHSYKGRVGQ